MRPVRFPSGALKESGGVVLVYQGGAGKELNPDPASAEQSPSALSQPRLRFSRMRLLRRLSPQQSRNVATQTFPPQESALPMAFVRARLLSARCLMFTFQCQ